MALAVLLIVFAAEFGLMAALAGQRFIRAYTPVRQAIPRDQRGDAASIQAARR